MYQFVSLLTIIAVCVWPPPASCQLVCAMANNVHLFIWWFFAGRKFKWRFVLPETSQLEINAHSTTTPTAPPLHRIWPIFPFKMLLQMLPTPSSLWTIISHCGLDYLEDFTWWQELFGKQWWLSARMRPHFSFFLKLLARLVNGISYS